MVWGCISAAGTTNLCFIKGNMNPKQYVTITKENLVQSVEKLGVKDNFQYYQDNDPKQQVRLWLMFNCPKVHETLLQSKHINVIERFWAHLENQLKKYVIRNKKDLGDAIKEDWGKRDPLTCKKLVETKPKILNAERKNTGLPTKY
ncbi:uncharacterized protein LOC128867030 [Anastrepha ludens]|uniref:uncharacterized protein LOC128867030 n=1 Tax=Anastrepha ludens TaxID=28586 RepID=UPI0023B17C0C|nr:uncharacterized protein LOC128867030 [Anastrepha ludens]